MWLAPAVIGQVAPRLLIILSTSPVRDSLPVYIANNCLEFAVVSNDRLFWYLSDTKVPFLTYGITPSFQA